MQGLRLSIRADDGGNGRTTMLNKNLKVFDMSGDLAEERDIETAVEFKQVLDNCFGIKV